MGPQRETKPDSSLPAPRLAHQAVKLRTTVLRAGDAPVDVFADELDSARLDHRAELRELHLAVLIPGAHSRVECYSHRRPLHSKIKGFSKLVPEAIEKYIDELEDHDRRVRDAISVLTNCDIWDVFRLLWLCNDIHYANIMIPIRVS